MERHIVYLLVSMATVAMGNISEIARPGEMKEYCDREAFVADCGDRGVIVMDMAKYGRMALGRCLQNGFGHLKCERDVLQLMDERCSGRSRCHVRDIVDDLDAHNPCEIKDLKVYLEASYHCVSVSPPKELCSPLKQGHVTSEGTSLASRHLHHPKCLGEDEENVFHLSASPGQQINITLVDFGGSNAINSGHYCETYGEIEDEQTKQTTNICGGSQRTKSLTVTNSHKVKIKLLKSVVEQQNFIIKLKAVGCADLEPPPNAWVDRQGNRAKIGCQPGKTRWELICEDDKWLGIVGNCSSEDTMGIAMGLGKSDESSALPTDVTVALIASVATVACLTIITVGIILWKRYTVDNRIKRMQAAQKIKIVTDTDSLSRSSPQSTVTRPSPPRRPPRRPTSNVSAAHRPNSNYMSPIYLPSEQKEGENAIYDFCFAAPGYQQDTPLPMTNPPSYSLEANCKPPGYTTVEAKAYPEKALPELPQIIPTTDYATADSALPELIPTSEYATQDSTLPIRGNSSAGGVDKNAKNDMNTTALYATPTKKKDRKPPMPPKAKDRIAKV